eukprot:TRINITY_DN63424_c0_g1_i1.p1 TRINITY_DN63424_c0_g1~~TRINITY_DN63424_c0_g1_i1.p1  ORF type:complete len:656 (+),score=127.27 TRINITY_DN63424_c0_g1_i1:182-2149(+)
MTPPKAADTKPVGDEGPTLDVVQGRLEEILSEQSLTDDTFIKQNIDMQMYIPLATLVRHQTFDGMDKPVDVGILLAAARRSDKLSVDEEHCMVKPIFKVRRNTLILHDLPEDIAEEDLRALFASFSDVEALTTVRPDVNNTAYITFKTDDIAQSAALWLRSQNLRGESIKCAVKSEHFARTFMAATASQMMAQHVMPMPAMMWASPWMAEQGGYHQWQASGGNFGGFDTTAQDPWGVSQMYWHQAEAAGCWATPRDTGHDGMFSGDKGDYGKGGGKDRGGKAKGKGRGRRKGGGSFMTNERESAQLAHAEAMAVMSELVPSAAAEMQRLPRQELASDPSTITSTAMTAAAAATSVAASSEQASPEMGPLDASAVVAAAAAYGGMDSSVFGESEIIDEGYKHAFRKYDRSTIMEVCNAMDEILKPESYTAFEEEHAYAASLFRQIPCKDWAPMPTPMMPFAHEKKNSDMADYNDGGTRGRKERCGSNWSKSSMTSGVDGPEDDWGDSWGDAGGRRRKRSSHRNERYGPGRGDTSKGGDADPKESTRGRASSVTRGRASSVTRSMTWVEKARAGFEKGGGGGAQVQKWCPKGQVDEATDKIADENATVTGSAHGAAPEAADGVAVSADASSEATKPSKPSWADKVRLGKATAPAATK